MRKNADGLVITESRLTEPHETRAAAPIPSDDVDADDDFVITMFGDDRDRALTDLALDTIGELRDDYRRLVAEEIGKLEARLQAAHEVHTQQIHDLLVELAEDRGQLAQINKRERGPQGDKGERGLRSMRGPKGARGDAGLAARPAPPTDHPARQARSAPNSGLPEFGALNRPKWLGPAPCVASP